MEWIDMIGYVAAACTTISFLPQAMQILKTKDCTGISLTMYTIFTFGVVTWLAFGILKESWPIIIANAITFFFSFSYPLF